MDIYSILTSKPHNPHYLKRYFSFIKMCLIKNIEVDVKTHKHHICPKANDMFPEYASLSKHKWNMAKLTPRQHFLSHVMLWKAYPESISQMNALWQMKHKNGERIYSKTYEKLFNAHSKSVSERFKRKISVYDDSGNYIKVSPSKYDTSRHTPISANRVVARNADNEYIIVPASEFRNRTDLVGSTNGMKIWNNGEKHVVSFEMPSENFIRGMVVISDEEKRTRNEKRLATLSNNYTENELFDMRSAASKKYWDSIPKENRKKSSETKKKMSAAAKEKNVGFFVTYKCPICGKEGQKANISRHHGLDGEKCRW